MEAVIRIFTAKSEEEEEEDRIREERQKMIDAHLAGLDSKRREFEKKKIQAYRIKGKEYLLPGETP